MNPETNDTGAEIAALKNQVFTLLVALIVVSGTLTVYLYRQVSMANKDLALARQVEASMEMNQTNFMVTINRLVGFGEKHPDFTAQVLKKYGIAPVAGVPANAQPLPPAKAK